MAVMLSAAGCQKPTVLGTFAGSLVENLQIEMSTYAQTGLQANVSVQAMGNGAFRVQYGDCTFTLPENAGALRGEAPESCTVKVSGGTAVVLSPLVAVVVNGDKGIALTVQGRGAPDQPKSVSYTAQFTGVRLGR